ncbi:nitroreductase/quinone reductase family protein [Okibacterium endophyticum]
MNDSLLRVINRLHRWVLRITHGRVGWTVGPMRVVELHTIGRLSGERRSTLLTSPVYDRDRIVLVASKGGDDRHPQWYLNLLEHPDVEITTGSQTRRMRARTASAHEKAELWPRIVSAYRGYAAYQRRTDRDIPVVICERV